MLPSVSVVMAAFDAERFVGEAIQSALAQDYPSELVDVVVVDDGSTDATAAIARYHAEESGRVRVIGRPNGGNVAATNTGFDCARGESSVTSSRNIVLPWLSSNRPARLLTAPVNAPRT